MYIGIDLGTSSVKLILVSPQGEVIKTVTKSYDLFIPKPSWSEQKPEDWYTQTIEALKELVKNYESSIKSISFSGQMHGLVLLDENDEVIRPALLWNDQRTIREVEYLHDHVGLSRLVEETGNIALTGLTAPKILWVKHNEPENFKRIKKIMLPKDYLIYKLSGSFATDVSDVSGTLYFDVKNKRYSSYMLDILEINESQLPRVYESFHVVGHLNKKIASDLNICQDVKIVAGGGDQAVGAVGVGIVDEGECSISLGTSGVVFVASEHFKVDHQSYLQSYAHANGKYHLMGVMLNAAGSLKWWSEHVFQNYNYSDFFMKLNQTSYRDDLFFLPYLTGERAPINDPLARGVFFGLRVDHRKEHMDRAVIEGVTFGLKETFILIKNLGVPISRVRITGGGAKSPVWAQMISDIMNCDVVTVEVEEGPAFGAAILAMVGDGLYKNVKEACSTIVKTNALFTPNQDSIEVYEEKFNFYQKLYPKFKELFIKQTLYK